MIIDILIFCVIGLLGGLVISFVGAGASLIILPTLITLFTHLYGAAEGIKVAIGTTMASIMVTALIGAWRQRKHIQVDRSLMLPVSIAYFIGAFSGSFISHWLPSTWLHFYIGGLIFFAAVKNLFFPMSEQLKKPLPKVGVIFLIALAIGFLCSMAGIASGLLFIPFISRYLPHRKAVATSIACGLTFAIFGTLGYVLSGWGKTGLPAFTIGYVYWPAVLAMSVTTFISMPFFMRLAHKTNINIIKKIFYVFLFVVGLYLFFVVP